MLKYNIYKCNCGEIYYTFDNGINLLELNGRKIKTSPQLTDIISKIGASSRSFEDAENIIKEFGISEISDTTIRFITENIGKIIFNETQNKSKENYENIVKLSETEYVIKTGEIMYIEFDGSMLRTILSKGTEWKELKLGTIFIKNKKGKVLRKEYISYFGKAEDFKIFLFNLAVEMGYMEMEKVIVIADGAHWIWNICKELFPDAIEILDYYHLKENVYEYYKVLYKDDEIKAKKEAKKIIKMIDKGKVISKILEKIPIIENRTETVVNLPNYIDNNKNRINYVQYKNQNYDIGSGVIESGNKNVIQHRLKQTGMKWLNDSVQSIATLRCKIFSNRWGEVTEKIQALFPVFA